MTAPINLPVDDQFMKKFVLDTEWKNVKPSEVMFFIEDVLMQELNQERNTFVRQLKERKYFIAKDGMAEKYIQELINDYESIIQKDTL